MNSPDIIFPNLGFKIQELDPVAFVLFGIPVYWYGLIIVTGIISGLFLAMYRAKKSGQNPDVYSDFLMYGLVTAILGARIYYVAFAWNDYKDNLLSIFAFREGGLAIYGGVIGAILSLILYTKWKKLDFWLLADTAAPALILGQAIGRWGNFFNMEAFGGYTNSLFAMSLKADKAKYIPSNLVDKIQSIDGISYLQVQPTFFYESMWCLFVLILLIVYTKHKKFVGEVFWLYMFGYGIGRMWIEGMRTDQLFLFNTSIPVSQLLAASLAVTSFAVIVYLRYRNRSKVL